MSLFIRRSHREPSTQPHSLCNRLHTGIIVLLLLSTLRWTPFVVGCTNGKSEGELGGACHPAEGSCHEHDWCDEGVCLADRCTRYTAVPPEPPPCSDRFPSEECAADELAEICPARRSAASFCAALRTVDAGAVLYCCAPCWQTDDCKLPNAGFHCNAPHSPTERNPGLICAVRHHYDLLATTDYCCAATDTCFEISEPMCGTLSGNRAYVCTGRATPEGACETIDGGDSNRFCCADPDGGLED